MVCTIPPAFIERYAPISGDASKFTEYIAKPLPRSFRVNTIKSNSVEVVERLESYGFNLSPVPWYKDAFISNSDERLGTTLEHFLGEIYIQELTSMLPPIFLKNEIKNANSILDACAAPGSKATQIAALMNNKGVLISNDLKYQRIKALRGNIDRLGVLNTVVTNYDFRSFPNLKFDVILLDAPCSSEGMCRKDPSFFRRWNERRYSYFSGIQKTLIAKAFNMLNEGGTLLYSTCTFSPEENEAVVNTLFENKSAEIIPISLPNLISSNGITEWNDSQYSSDLTNALRIWPYQNNTDGFFIAKIIKNA